MSGIRNPPRKAPRPTEALIRGETADERLIMMAIQIDHTMHVAEQTMRVVEAMAALFNIVLRVDVDGLLDGPGTVDNEQVDREIKAAAKEALDRLAAAIGGAT